MTVKLSEAEILEQKRQKYWSRIDATIYDRQTGDTLMPFQREGVEWLGRHPRAILADDMGLGKTVQALASIIGADAFPCLFITQATLRRTMEAQVDKWTGLKSYVMESGNRGASIRAQMTLPRPFYICHYEGVRAEAVALRKIEWKSIIVDEATNIKNRSAQRTKAVKSLKAPRITLLSGTPLLNSPIDLWSLLNYLDPVKYSSYWAFEKRYCNPPETPIWMGDYSFKPIGSIVPGDTVIGWEPGVEGHDKRLVRSEVLAVNVRQSDIVKVTFESGRTLRCTPDHRWLTASHGQKSEFFSPAKPGRTLCHVIDPYSSLSSDLQLSAGYLSGVYDGEGTNYRIAQSYTANLEVRERIKRELTMLDLPFSEDTDGVFLNGGRATYARFVSWTQPTKHRKWFDENILNSHFLTKDKIVSVEPDEYGDVISMETTTGNYVAWGYASKNCILGGYLGKQVIGYKNVNELKMHIQVRMLRRRKDEVLKDLPPKIYKDVLLDLPPWQRKVYNKAHDELIVEIQNDKTLTVATALAKMTRLKQIAVSPQWTLSVDHKALPIKVEALDEILDERPEKKTLIFTMYATVANGLEKYLKSTRPALKIFLLTGATPMDKRGQMEKDFQNLSDSETAVWISTITAGGMGLTLTAADTVVFMDKEWRPKINEQAADRAHRIGQKDNVQVISLIARDTVEEHVERILDKKTALFDDIVEKDGGFQSTKLTFDDIKGLL